MQEEEIINSGKISDGFNNGAGVLVTGGTGFLGAYIIKSLVEKGHRVRALKRRSALPFFIDKNILDKVEWVEGDILDPVSLEEAMNEMDAIVHSAALVSFAKEDRKRMYQVNVDGTANVVNCAIEKGIKRILHVSSIAALGRTTKTEMINEEKKWEDSSNNTHYALSKHASEMHVWRGFAEGLEGVIINPSTILGYGDWNQSSCAIFKNAYREFPWYTKGINGFVGVEDVAETVSQLLFSRLSQERYIVCSENWSFRQLFETIAIHFNKKPPSKEATKTLGEIAWRLEKIKSLVTGKKALLSRETAKIAHSKTSFDHRKILGVLPGFRFTPLEKVIKNSCEKYEEAIRKGVLTL